MALGQSTKVSASVIMHKGKPLKPNEEGALVWVEGRGGRATIKLHTSRCTYGSSISLIMHKEMSRSAHMYRCIHWYVYVDMTKTKT